MDSHRQIITRSAGETKEIGSSLAHYFVKSVKQGVLTGPVIICLYGQLGSGKTTFTQGFALGLGIKNRLLSPTFIIVRHYEIPAFDRHLDHIDCYRMNNNEDLTLIGLHDLITNPRGFIVVEWADRLGTHIPEKRMDIKFSALNDASHTLDIVYDSYGFTH